MVLVTPVEAFIVAVLKVLSNLLVYSVGFGILYLGLKNYISSELAENRYHREENEKRKLAQKSATQERQ